MSLLMVVGVIASIVGSMWAKFEHDCPRYWTDWGISQRTAHVINLGTSLLFPGGYLLVLFAPGLPWWGRVLAVLATHFIGVQIVAPLVMSALFMPRVVMPTEHPTSIPVAVASSQLHSKAADRAVQLCVVEHVARRNGWDHFVLSVPGARRHANLARALRTRGFEVVSANEEFGSRFQPTIGVGKPVWRDAAVCEVQYVWSHGGDVGDGGVMVVSAESGAWRVVDQRIEFVI